MNIMGVGPQEMMIIAVIALLIFGPGKLPEVMGQAGKLVRDFRRMSAELSGEFEKTIAEARDATAGLTGELGSMSKEVDSITRSVKKDLGIKSPSTTKAKGTTSKSGSAGKTTGKSGSTKAGTSTSTSKVGGKSTTAKSSTTTSSKSTTSTTAAAKKPATPVATREDPSADFSLFEPTPIERPKRVRKAVPSVIGDPTPRTLVVPDGNGESGFDDGLVAVASADDAVSRARQRRRSAGYARTSA